MGLDILDLVFRLERRFGIRISRDNLYKALDKSESPDMKVGELFEYVRRRAVLAGVLDEEMDAESLWIMFLRDVSDALGVEPCEVAKDQWLVRDLGAS
jgi:hypothetical protein